MDEKKNKENYYGYKSHDDQRHKLIQNYKVTTASVHYSQVLEELLDHEIDEETGKKRPVNADSAYRSKEKEESLIAVNIESRISEKGSRNHPLTTEQKASNTEKSRIISRDEIIFSAQSSHGSKLRSNNRNDESGLHI